MLRLRNLLVLALAVGVGALSAPAVVLATGPSAGDQQYVDPLASSHHSSSTTTSTSTPTPAPAATATATVSSSTPTTPTSSASASTASSQKTLPFTGMNAWLAAGIGLGLLGLGAVLRRVVSRRV